ncbi:UDP-N-acetylmuramate dehydrogenase [Fontimonas thermophila]|uniref:UDP-N-acetylenolpyruvoylglucosamine reductase n=1 Tax=Fontimonas thermophila TaxID=1076937 RepID=A0A1I2K7G3_9GAMM|nr:UDP-N-acetylmuramate dehydrogenase [Fontimonas thermophila]SFF61021.1 UDP-N-acetylmuramate dehydrogenase [Fontimonas thermophila]
MSTGRRDPLPAIRGRVLRSEPMTRHTTWRVGGPADRYFEPADREDLIAFVRALPADEPVLWLGLGSNLLVRDGGWRGTIIALHGALDALRLEEAGGTRLIYAEAGVHCARLAKFAERHHLAGLGFMAGIPGTVGGALAMNAGAWGGETWPNVAMVEMVFRDGSVRWLEPTHFRYGYREVELPAGALGFLAARFKVSVDTDGAHARYTREALARRKASQPVGKPSAGSTFRNPPGDHAARLIESCGLKGYRIGGAEVSTQHANFLITDDTASAADVEALITHIRRTVKAKTGIDLEPEVRIVGEPL